MPHTADPHTVTTVEQLEALLDTLSPASVKKELPFVHPHYRALIEASPFAVLATNEPAGSTCHRAASTDTSIRGQVSLAPALAAQALPTDTVFIFARAVQGPRMPLAVQRGKVSDLPLNFKLDDSLAVSPDFKISGFTEVRIESRISRSGSATPSPGDLIGMGPVVKPGARDLKLQIDQARP